MKKRFLSIRINSILHIAGMFLLIVIIIFFSMLIFAYQSAEKLDRDQALLQVERIQDGFTFTTEMMKQTSTDWSKWDETYAFVEGTNPTYVDDNLYIEALQSIQMDMVLIYSHQGTLLYHQAYDFDEGTSSSVEQSIINQIESLQILTDTNPDAYTTGYITFQEQLLLIATSPIMQSSYTGDVIGTFIFIRIIDDEYISLLSNIVGIPFSISTNTNLSTERLVNYNETHNNQIKIQALLLDLNESYDLMLEMTVPMSATSIINQAIEVVTWITALIVVSFLFLIILMLDKQLFKRIKLMTDDIRELDSLSDIKRRLDIDSRKDEISYIGNEINTMLDKLEESYQEIKQLAYQDHLTGTHNRLSFYRYVEKAILEHKSSFAILFLDLDGFKEINDNHGHETGDFLLIEVALRIRSVLGTEGIISRAGGDEFLIYYPSDNTDLISQLCLQMIDSLAHDIDIDGHHVLITTSIGIAIYPTDGDTLKALIRHSDLAMYHAKGLGKNQFQFKIED
ncbi:MAG: diguanylate cyclase [Acholeplasmataceae bacterium]|jgi:diguanylate cyclase (GGDEF)-like protein|nr:diguanylate cyclase [Acholeplasmataceae bacterium]